MRHIKEFKLFESVQSLVYDVRYILSDISDISDFKVKVEEYQNDQIIVEISKLDDNRIELLGNSYIKYKDIKECFNRLSIFLSSNNYKTVVYSLLGDKLNNPIDFEDILDVKGKEFNDLKVYDIYMVFGQKSKR